MRRNKSHSITHRKKWTHADIGALLKSQEKSGMSIVEFCRAHKMADSQFYTLRRRFHNATKPASQEFIPVQLPQVQSDKHYEIVHHGITVRVPSGFHAEEVANLCREVFTL